MALIWPLTLPQRPQRNGYSHAISNETIRSSMDTGPNKVRYRGGNKPEIVTATYVLNKTQKNILTTFLTSTAKSGAICFDWPCPDNGTLEYVLARFCSDNEILASFTPMAARHWQVTIKLEIWPSAPLTETV